MSARGAAGLLVAVAAAVATAALSNWTVPLHDADEALLRLAWRSPGSEIETCRALTEEELARTPAHMRRGDEVCESRGVAWRLVASVDGRTVVDDPVRPAGIRGDRPLAVLRDVPVTPGRHRLEVRFTPADTTDWDGNGRLWLEGFVDVAPRAVLLVTLEQGAPGGLVARRP